MSGHTYTQDNYSNPHCACAPRVNNIVNHYNYAHIWDPHLQKDIKSLETVQKFALKICSKQWDQGYDGLLELFSLPSMETVAFI